MKKLLCFAIILCSIIAHSSFAQVPPPFVVPALNNLPANAAGYLQNNGTGILSWGTSSGGVAWGAITGTLSSQSDLNTALGLKAPSASPTFTGTVTIPGGASISGFAPLNSPTFTGSPTVPGYLTTSAAASTYSPLAGSSSITTVGVLSAGSIPYSLLTGTPTVGTLGALLAGTMTNGDYCTYATGGTIACNSAGGGSMTWPAAAGIAVYAGSSAWGSSIAESDGYVVYGSGGAWGKSNAPAISAANMTSFPPATLGTGTSVTLTAPREYYVCTGACSVTLPATTAPGNEFCVMNDDNVATVITLTPPTGTYMENQARSAYCTVGHALASGGAVADKICVVGRDSTHYLTIATGGVVTCQ